MATTVMFVFAVEVQEAEWTEKNKVMQGSSSGVGGLNASPRKNARGDGASLRRSCDNSVSEDQSATLPLLHLVRQLLRNASTQTLMRLQVSSDNENYYHILCILCYVSAMLNSGGKNCVVPNKIQWS